MSVHLIIGGGGGIGGATVRRLRDEGHTVVAAGPTADHVEQVAAETGAVARTLDATDLDATRALVEEIVAEHGRIDGVANCAGSVVLKPAHLTTAAEFDAVIATNLTTAFSTVRAAAPAMRREGGSIVLVSTAAVATGLANHEAVAAAKGGVEALVRSAAATYGARGVRVNAVAPGLVETRQTERLVANEQQADASRAMHVLGRFGQPDEVASAITWLLSPDNGWVTGQVLGVDGGLGHVRTRSRA